MNPWDQRAGLEAHMRQAQGRVISGAVGAAESRMDISRHAIYQRKLAALAKAAGISTRALRDQRRKSQ